MSLKNQLYFSAFFDEFDELIEKDEPELIKLFEDFIDISKLIPQSLYDSYYSSTGHPQVYHLTSMISALILEKLLSLPTTILLLIILNFSNELRKFCGFTNIPHLSQFSRFKTDSYDEINKIFHKLIDITEPICNEINSELAYLCGHFGYYQKSHIVTNGLGIIRHIDFYDIVLNESTKNPSIIKDKYDSKSLIYVLENFFILHPDFIYKFYLGDSGFDVYDNYHYLNEYKNIIPIIPLNPRNKSDLPKPGMD